MIVIGLFAGTFEEAKRQLNRSYFRCNVEESTEVESDPGFKKGRNKKSHEPQPKKKSADVVYDIPEYPDSCSEINNEKSQSANKSRTTSKKSKKPRRSRQKSRRLPSTSPESSGHTKKTSSNHEVSSEASSSESRMSKPSLSPEADGDNFRSKILIYFIKS